MSYKDAIVKALRTNIELAPGLSRSDLEWLVRCENACNQATKDFIEGVIDQETWADTLEFFGHNMDEYTSITEENLVILGF